MVILDLNHLVIAAFFSAVKNHTNIKIEEKNVLHMALSAISSVNKKFNKQYGNMLIACDSTNSWRKSVFPYYKAARKKSRDLSDVDWPTLFAGIDTLKKDLKEYFPYKVVSVDGAEADDVIATICKIVDPKENILIVSFDKDFLQLQYMPNIKQYDFINSRWLVEENPQEFLLEHILKGDQSDGIPNVMSPDNCFVIGERQTVLTKKRKNTLLEEDFQNDQDHKYFRNYMRNKTLIDFDEIPASIHDAIVNEYASCEVGGNKNTMKQYFMSKKMVELFDRINDF